MPSPSSYNISKTVEKDLLTVPLRGRVTGVNFRGPGSGRGPGILLQMLACKDFEIHKCP